jgi:predicted aspartyl protease
MSDPYGIPIEWYGDGLIVQMWLEGPKSRLLCRLLLDTGATHLCLNPFVIDDLGLETVVSAISMVVLGVGTESMVSLYQLPLAELDEIRRTNLYVVPVELPEVIGYHGVLGMNWLRTFAHVGFMRLQTDRPILELHDPS